MKTIKMTQKQLTDLYEAILKLKTLDECKKFFRDLCTLSELSSMAERLAVAKMIQREVSYRGISTQTGSSTATITRVAHWLHHGMGGYKIVLDRTKTK